MVKKNKSLRTLLISFFLALVTLIVFSQVGGHEFIYYDDNLYLTENPIVQRGLSWSGLVWAFTTMHVANWHPLTWLSHMLDVQLFGLSSGAHHLVNVLIHMINTVLLFLVLLRMTGAQWRSAFVAALFAIHPLHVESVAWAAERKDVLSGFFGLLTLWAYVRYAEQPNVPRYFLVFLLLALSLLSKPMLVTMPFLLLLLDNWPLGRMSIHLQSASNSSPVRPQTTVSRLLVEKIPMFALCVASSVATVIAQKRGGAVADLSLDVGARLANAMVGYVQYLGKTFWPVSLSVFYPHPGNALPAWQVAGACLILVLLTVWVLFRLRRAPWLAVGWFWFLGTLVPVIGLVQVGAQSIADRYTYIPLIGIFIMVAWEAQELPGSRRYRPQMLWAASVAVIVTLTAITWLQTGYWKTHETLFRHAISTTKNNCVALGSLADYLSRKGDIDEAYAYVRESLRLCPKNEEAWYNLGILQRNRGELEDAESSLLEAIRLKPQYAKAWSNLGSVYLARGHMSEAIQALLEATRLTPNDAIVWFNLGFLYGKNDRVEEAIAAYHESIRLKPDYAPAWNNLGITYQISGRLSDAVSAFQQTVQLNPDNYTAWYNLGVLYMKNWQFEDAAKALGEAVHIRPDHTPSWYQLGLTHLSLRRQQEALEVVQKLRAIDPGKADDLLRQISNLR